MVDKQNYKPGHDQKAITSVANKYYGGHREMFDAHGWDWPGQRAVSVASTKIVERYRSIKAFEYYHDNKPEAGLETAHDLLDAYDGAWMKGFWGWSPESWGCVGYPSAGRRKTVLQNDLNTRLMFIYVTESARGQEETQKHLINRIVGFYLLSEEVGHRNEFQEKFHHDREPNKWIHSIKALRAFEIKESVLPLAKDVEERCNLVGWGTRYAMNSDSLSAEAYEKLKSYTYEEVAVFGSDNTELSGLSLPKSLSSARETVNLKHGLAKGTEKSTKHQNAKMRKHPFAKYEKAFITSFLGWGAAEHANFSVRTENVANKYLKESNPFLVAIYITYETDYETHLKGRLVGFYEVSHNRGDATDFMSDAEAEEPIEYDYSYQAIRAWEVIDGYQPQAEKLLPEIIPHVSNIFQYGRELSESGFQELKRLPLEAVPIFGQPHPEPFEFWPQNSVDPALPDMTIKSPNKNFVNDGGGNLSGYFAEPENPNKHIYILKLNGPVDSIFQISVEGKSIIKVGLSHSPKKRCDAFNKSLPKCKLNWIILKATSIDGIPSFPNRKIAATGEMSMKRYLAEHADYLGGEFYCVDNSLIDEVWTQGKAAAQASLKANTK